MSAGGGGGGFSRWAAGWTKKGVVLFGGTGVVFGPQAAYALAALVGSALAIAFASLLIVAGHLVTGVKSSGVTWTNGGIQVGQSAGDTTKAKGTKTCPGVGLAPTYTVGPGESC